MAAAAVDYDDDGRRMMMPNRNRICQTIREMFPDKSEKEISDIVASVGGEEETIDWNDEERRVLEQAVDLCLKNNEAAMVKGIQSKQIDSSFSVDNVWNTEEIAFSHVDSNGRPRLPASAKLKLCELQRKFGGTWDTELIELAFRENGLDSDMTESCLTDAFGEPLRTDYDSERAAIPASASSGRSNRKISGNVIHKRRPSHTSSSISGSSETFADVRVESNPCRVASRCMKDVVPEGCRQEVYFH